MSGPSTLAILIAVSAVVRAWVGSKIDGPWFIPDEVTYAELGRSFYSVGHFEILGTRPDFQGLVYPLFVGLPLHLGGIERGYALAKTLQALVMSLAALPIYYWGRSLAGSGWALVAAALTLAAPVLGLAGFLMTETIFYPVFCLAAWLLARAIARPSLARQTLALMAILLAALTRLQAIVLALVFVLAIATDAALARTWLRGLRRFIPSLAAIAVGGVAWVGLTAATGGKALGIYSVTTDVHYDVADALRFVAYHAADLLLVTAVVPAVALVALAAPAARGRERSGDVRAFVATTIALTAVLVPMVGIYASEFTGRIAERNLSFLAPLFFLALVTWLARGASGRTVVLVASAAALVLLAATPWDRFVVAAAEPDAFTLVPFVELRERLPALDPALLIVAVAAALLAPLLLPRSIIRFLPLLLTAALVAAGAAASDVATSTANAYERGMAGADRRWIARSVAEPVRFLYGGEKGWSGGGPVWVSAFWNPQVEHADELFGARIAGRSPPIPPAVNGDGRVVARDGVPRSYRFVVASARLALAGVPVASSDSGFVLWRVQEPLRILTRKDGVDPVTRTLDASVRLVAYGCRGGSVELTLLSPDDRVVRVGRRRAVRLRAGRPWSGSVSLPAPHRPGEQPCTLSLAGGLGVRAERLDFVPS